MKLNAKKQQNINTMKKRVLIKGKAQFINIHSSISLSHQYNKLTTLS